MSQNRAGCSVNKGGQVNRGELVLWIDREGIELATIDYQVSGRSHAMRDTGFRWCPAHPCSYRREAGRRNTKRSARFFDGGEDYGLSFAFSVGLNSLVDEFEGALVNGAAPTVPEAKVMTALCLLEIINQDIKLPTFQVQCRSYCVMFDEIPWAISQVSLNLNAPF